MRYKIFRDNITSIVRTCFRFVWTTMRQLRPMKRRVKELYSTIMKTKMGRNRITADWKRDLELHELYVGDEQNLGMQVEVYKTQLLQDSYFNRFFFSLRICSSGPGPSHRTLHIATLTVNYIHRKTEIVRNACRGR